MHSDSHHARGPFTASSALTAAALAGLLSAGPLGCTATGKRANADHDAAVTAHGGATNTGGTDAAVVTQGGASNIGGTTGFGGHGGSATSQGGSSPDAAVADASYDASTPDSALVSLVCDGGMDAGVITSSQVVVMTLASFTADCDARGGALEIHPHCGGSNSCKGMSYDTGTQVLTEHTCRGMNACAGFSCIICA